MMIKKRNKPKKHKKLGRNIALEELLKLVPWFMIIDGVLLIVSVPAKTGGLSFLTGLILGSVISLARYYSLGVSADNAVHKRPDKAQVYMSAMFAARYIGTFIALILCVVLLKVNVVGLVIPLIYPPVIIYADNLIKK